MSFPFLDALSGCTRVITYGVSLAHTHTRIHICTTHVPNCMCLIEQAPRARTKTRRHKVRHASALPPSCATRGWRQSPRARPLVFGHKPTDKQSKQSSKTQRNTQRNKAHKQTCKRATKHTKKQPNKQANKHNQKQKATSIHNKPHVGRACSPQ